jgi:predicted PurR-regulated permease PerM
VPEDRPNDVHAPRVHPAVATAAAYAWRLVVIGIVVLALLWFLRETRVVFLPLVVALLLVRALSPVSGWLRRHGWRPGLASLVTLVAFLALVAGLLALVVPSFVGEVDAVGPTLTDAVDDVEDWLVEDSPFELSRESVDRMRERIGDATSRALSSSDGVTLDRATVVAEVVTGSILALILTFFLLRDGRRFVDWATGGIASPRRERVRRALDRSWATLAGYLRGATLLGVVESALIGLTLAVSGGSLVAPVMLLTFLGAYVPLVGATVSGVVAVLVALVTGGTGSAVAVAVVAVLVQQLDNDLLAPVIYGRALSLHPVVILVGVVAGGALFGLAGTILAVPALAVALNATQGYRQADPQVGSDGGGRDPAVDVGGEAPVA